VEVLDWNGTAWTQVGATLGGDIDGNVNNAVFGHAIALSGSGSRLAVGAPDAASGAGKVQAYDWNGVGWVQAGGDIDGVSGGDRSGRAVVLSADGMVVAIGAPFRDGAGSRRGQVRVFGWSGSAWMQVGADLDGTEDGADFGYAIALSADGLRLVVGVPYASVGGAASGQAFAFDWNGSAWVQAGASIGGLTTNSFAGRSIALSGSGTRLLFGAPYDGAGSTAIGLVRVFDFPRPGRPRVHGLKAPGSPLVRCRR